MKNVQLKTLIIDNDRKMHQKYAAYFRKLEGYTLAGSFCTVHEALKAYRNLNPDIIITEVSLLGLSGIDGIHLIRRQDKTAKIIVVSFKHDFDVIKRAFKTGANGYLTKPISDERLSQALKAVMNDGAALSHDVAKKVITMFQQKRYPQLSKRENQIAEYLGQGETYKGIAKKLFVTPSTVNFHIQNIYLKLNVNSKSEALQKLRLLMAS